MGKHNGKARKSGLSVGGALVNRARKQGRDGSGAAFMHTTERAPEGNLRSVIETNDLEEMMNLASLAERDFTAERGQAVVVGWSAAEKKESECEASERAQAEARHAHRLVIPRRPEWNSSTTASALDAQERRSFLAWRRDLAELEGEERLVLTPFEKNLEVWRQLWRVVERSDAVVQVLDARDPLTYWCADLAAYAREAHPAKRCLLVLNKADLLPAAIRRDWSRYFAQRGLDFVFWSARAATQEQEAKALRQREAEAAGEHFEDSDDEYAGEEDGWDSELDVEGETGGRREVEEEEGEEEEEEGDEEEEEEDDEEEEGDEEEEDDEEEEEFGAESKNARPTSPSSSPLRPKPVAPFALRPASSHPAPPSHPPTKVLSAKELLGVLAALGRACRRESRALGVAPASRGSRAVVGLTGYPNVGKSSTINALFGSKKTGVAPTPGKTKHFQTLDVSDRLQLCDCPGLVMPQFAQSRAEMVAAGVLPVDRLTDVRAPVSIVAERCAPTQLERVYGLQLPSSSHAKGRATAAELLRALGRARGWVASSGLPDETRSGRRVLKDYVDGRLRYAKPPPGASRESLRAAEELALTGDGLDGQEDAVEAPYQGPSASRTREGGLDGVEEGDLSRRNKVGDVSPAAPVEPSPAPPRRADAAPRARRPADMDDADLELLEELELEAAMAAAGVRRATPARATHKFQKKPSRASQGKPKGYVDDGGNYDGAALPLGKRGGIVRVAVRD